MNLAIDSVGLLIGGHTNTVNIKSLDGKESIGVDTGFIVCNPVTYPNFLNLMETVGVEMIESNMSLAVSRNQGELEWAGKNLNTIFAQRKNLFSIGMYRMIYDIMRFNTQCKQISMETDLMDSVDDHWSSKLTIGKFLDKFQYSQYFYDNYLVPMTAAIWSCPADVAFNEFPILTLAKFMRNHCLLQVGNRPVWRTVNHGSKTYISALTKSVSDIRLNCAIQSVERLNEKVILKDQHGKIHEFDHVIFATHSDQALNILGDKATKDEREILGAIKYSKNHAILHRDINQMPKDRKTWSSWNYLTSAKNESESTSCTVTYHMNKLQSFVKAGKYGEIFVTLNPLVRPDPKSILQEFEYEHPVYNIQVLLLIDY